MLRNTQGRLPDRFPTSTLDRLLYVNLPFNDDLTRCVVTMDRRLDSPLLARAVELSLDAAPIVDCKYVPHPWRPLWERCSPDRVIPFSMVQADDREREIRSFLAEPLDAMRGPQVAVRLVRSHQDTLCVKLNHLAADAAGLLDYVRLLGSIYQQLRTDADYQPPGLPEDRGQGQVLRGAGLRAVLRGCLSFRVPPSPWGFPQTGSDFSSRAFLLRRIDSERVARLRAYCRAKGITFTDVLLTAFYRALISILNPPAGALLPVELSVDLRRYLPSRRAIAICDLAAAYFPVIRHRPGVCFDETLGEVRTATAKAKAGLPWLGAALFSHLVFLIPGDFQTPLARKLIRRVLSTGRAYPILSNVGVVDPRIFNFGDATAVDMEGFAPAVYPPNFMLTVYLFRGQLSITSSFCDQAIDPQLVETFFNHLVDELPV